MRCKRDRGAANKTDGPDHTWIVAPQRGDFAAHSKIPCQKFHLRTIGSRRTIPKARHSKMRPWSAASVGGPVLFRFLFSGSKKTRRREPAGCLRCSNQLSFDRRQARGDRPEEGCQGLEVLRDGFEIGNQASAAHSRFGRHHADPSLHGRRVHPD